MDPLTILATVDAAITSYAHAMRLLAEARQRGLISEADEAKRLSKVAESRALAGLPPVAPG